MADTDRVRIDKWLWAARFFKTRSQAAQAIALGRVRIEGDRIKPAREARIGETILIQAGDSRQQVVVKSLSGLRGPAAAARLLYQETPESLKLRARKAEQGRFGTEPARAIQGRPTKRDRRQLTDLDRG
jgi:ribosome-associated heat shock protein Hsp15